MKTFADSVIEFNTNLDFQGELPKGVRIMNPYREDKQAADLSAAFYRKYYNDLLQRKLVLGINPGRFGGGVTGVPFTDTKRLVEKCGIEYQGKVTHEPSSVFIYDMIDAYGTVKEFYQKFYINSICPLGFTLDAGHGKSVNYNYYDSKELIAMVYDFIVSSIKTQLTFDVDTDCCFCFGKGKNEKFLRMLNEEHKFFGRIVALEHPRFIVQYKSATRQAYIDKYIAAFTHTG